LDEGENYEKMKKGEEKKRKKRKSESTDEEDEDLHPKKKQKKNIVKRTVVKHQSSSCPIEEVFYNDEKLVFSVRQLEDNGLVKFCKNFLSKEESDSIFDYLLTTLEWQQSDIKIYGKVVKSPRLQTWMAEEGIN